MFKISELLKKSEETSNLMPTLIADSSILTRHVLNGLHSTRFAGKGDNFWQFKDYKFGDNVAEIDWRKSASINKLLTREKENETSKVLYFYYDRSKSMVFKSRGPHNKYYFAALISLTLARIFIKNKENVYLFNDKKIPVKCIHNLKNYSKNFLLQDTDNSFPNEQLLKQDSFLFIFSDFFYENINLEKYILNLRKKNITGQLIQILDPLEINFNIGENVRLTDMENQQSTLLSNSKDIKDSYNNKLQIHIEEIKEITKKYNWQYMLYSTDTNLNIFLLKLLKDIIIKKIKIN